MYDKKEIIKFLNENKVNYNLIEHEAVYTMEDLQKINIQKYGVEVKNLFLRDEKGKNHYLIVAKNDTKIDLKSLKDKVSVYPPAPRKPRKVISPSAIAIRLVPSGAPISVP